MRSGVLAQKVGMTRLFTEAGEHVPVTVLRLGNCQVVAHRTKDKNGYVALQLGAGVRKVQTHDQGRPRPFRSRQGRAQAQARRVPRRRRRADPGRRRDHGGSFRRRPICRRHRHLDRQGFRRRHEALEFRRLRASHGVSISHRSIGSTGGRQDPGKTFKNKKMPGHLGVDRVTTLNLKVGADRRRARPDPGRRRGSRRQGRLDHGARRGEEETAGRRAEARQVQARRDAAGAPALRPAEGQTKQGGRVTWN